jgi:HD-GYP domain-containing protein (c-di-GMP phosphodiesterase class II)
MAALTKLAPTQVLDLFQGAGSVNDRLVTLHIRILETMPFISRIACTLYDSSQDLLKTFVNSTRSGVALHTYQAKLAHIPSLQTLATSGQCRVLENIPEEISNSSTHSDWLLQQGYKSSFTVPMYDNGQLLGFIFFDSTELSYFTHAIQRDLLLYCNLINMALSNELAAVRSVLASAQVARDFANLRDFETGAHLERMAKYAKLIATGVAAHYQLSDETIEHIYLFAPLHDIGKIGIPDHILLKAGPLNAEERVIMESHVLKGEHIMQKVIGDFSLEHLPDSKVMQNIVACHHEFMNGTGYPRQLAGEQIPIEARIVTVADIFDALTSLRPYKKPWPVDQAIAELQRMADMGKLDQFCVNALATNIEQAFQIVERYPDPH